MTSMVFRRLAEIVFVLFGLVVLTFAISHWVPTDPARLAAGPQAREEQVAEVRREFGLDKPVTEQLWIYVWNLAHGNFGQSLQSRRPVAADLKTYFGATAELALTAGLIFVLAGIPLGVASAVNNEKPLDHVIRVFSLAGVSMPVFWLGLLLVKLFYGTLGWLPIGGRLGFEFSAPPSVTGMYVADSLLAGDWATMVDALKHLLLPSVTLAYGSLAVVTRMTRSGVLEILGQDYIRTARSKGLTERVVLYKHVLKNALVSVMTVIGLQIGSLLGGIFLVESIFAWPGLGTYAMKAIMFMDYNGIMGVTIVIGFAFMIINFLVDLIYLFVDPRIRYQ